MDKIENIILVMVGAILVLELVSIFLTGFYFTPDSKLIPLIAKDTNTLIANDSAFAQYIVQNSQTLEYLNKNCKVTSDTNEVTVLTCIKGVQ